MCPKNFTVVLESWRYSLAAELQKLISEVVCSGSLYCFQTVDGLTYFVYRGWCRLSLFGGLGGVCHGGYLTQECCV